MWCEVDSRLSNFCYCTARNQTTVNRCNKNSFQEYVSWCVNRRKKTIDFPSFSLSNEMFKTAFDLAFSYKDWKS